MNHTCLCLPSRSWNSFTDPGGMEGWVGLIQTTHEWSAMWSHYKNLAIFSRLIIILHSFVAEMLCITAKQVNQRPSKIIVSTLYKQTPCSANPLFFLGTLNLYTNTTLSYFLLSSTSYWFLRSLLLPGYEHCSDARGQAGARAGVRNGRIYSFIGKIFPV